MPKARNCNQPVFFLHLYQSIAGKLFLHTFTGGMGGLKTGKWEGNGYVINEVAKASCNY